MATMNAAEVTVGAALGTGAIWVAPNDVEYPTNAQSELPQEYKLLGYTSEAGVTISESRSNNPLRAWEARTVVYNAVTEYTEAVSFTPIQWNSDVAELTWGPNRVTVDETTGEIVAEHSADTLDPVRIVIETVPRQGVVKRYWGTFQLIERGEATLDGTTFDGRQLTFNAIGDERGVTMREATGYIVEEEPANGEEQTQETPDFSSMTKAELISYANENNIEGVTDSMTKDEMIAAIQAALEG